MSKNRESKKKTERKKVNKTKEEKESENEIDTGREQRILRREMKLMRIREIKRLTKQKIGKEERKVDRDVRAISRGNQYFLLITPLLIQT